MITVLTLVVMAKMECVNASVLMVTSALDGAGIVGTAVLISKCL